MIGNISDVRYSSDLKLSKAQLLDRLYKMGCDAFTKFMRSVGVFGQKDFVAEFSMELLDKVLRESMDEGYTASLKGLDSAHSSYIYVKYNESRYGNTCSIEVYGDTKYREMPLNFDTIVDDFGTELAMACKG